MTEATNRNQKEINEVFNNRFGELFQFLKEVEKDISKDEMKQVMIEKAINLKLMCDYVVSCSYGDYRNKFVTMADRLAKQIGYDYDLAVEKCRKKQEKGERYSDVGEDALTLAAKGGGVKKEPAKETRDENKSNRGHRS